MTWLSWLSHCIIFQISKENNELTGCEICCLLFGFFFLTHQKMMLSRAEDRMLLRTCRLLGQGQGLDLQSQGQGLQTKSSRTSLKPRTSLRTPPFVLCQFVSNLNELICKLSECFFEITYLNLFQST